jgi:hypothetical protein
MDCRHKSHVRLLLKLNAVSPGAAPCKPNVKREKSRKNFDKKKELLARPEEIRTPS